MWMGWRGWQGWGRMRTRTRSEDCWDRVSSFFFFFFWLGGGFYIYPSIDLWKRMSYLLVRR